MKVNLLKLLPIPLFLTLSVQTQAQSFSISGSTACKVEIKEDKIQCLSSQTKSWFAIEFTQSQPTRQAITLQSCSVINTDISDNYRYTIQMYGLSLSGERIIPAFYLDDSHFAERINEITLEASLQTRNLTVIFHEPVQSIEVTTYSNLEAGSLLQSFSTPLSLGFPDYSLSQKDPPCPIGKVLIACDGSSSVSAEEKEVLNDNVLTLIENLVDTRAGAISYSRFNSNLSSVSDENIPFLERRSFWMNEIRNSTESSSPQRPQSNYTNWEQVLDQAISLKPDLVILLTDGFPNWYENQKHSLSEDFTSLTDKANVLHKNGTRVWVGLLNTEYGPEHKFLYAITAIDNQAFYDNTTPSKLFTIAEPDTWNMIQLKQQIACEELDKTFIQLQVRPSPTDGNIEIISPVSWPEGEMQVISSDGKFLFSFPVESNVNRINVSVETRLDPGSYYLKLDAVDRVFLGNFVVIQN